MKKILFTIAAFIACNAGFAQSYIFTTVDSIPITSIKDQNKTGTCWSFSTIGMLESELIRIGKGEFNLSEMFVVHKTMEDRAQASVRMHGDISFSPGGSFYDVLYCYKNYGMVPEDVMPGIMYGANKHDHSELSAVAEAYVGAITKGNLKKISNVWQNGLSGIYDAYLGKCPDKFTYNGKEYTPKSFAKELGINTDDYISLTSFNHHPFYEKFSVEIQDNWRQALSYNLPLDEFLAVIRNSIKSGYTVAWGTDISETGFSRIAKKGIAVVPDDSIAVNKALSEPCPEKEITQQLRQEGFDDWSTTDDHGMLIFGITRDQNGKEYYMVKNSWDYDSGRNGIWYVSEAFVAYKTINIMVNRNAIPKEILKKMNIK
jgi:aminopeptidase C